MSRATVALLLLLAGTARAQSAREHLDAAHRHWKDLDYELVVEDATRALAAARGRRDRVEALRWKGSAQAVLGREPEAAATFEELFVLDPDYEMPPGTSPRILAVFRPARAAWQVKVEERLAAELGESLRALRLSAGIPARARGGLPLEIPVRLEDPARIADSVVLSFRRRGERHFSTITTSARAPSLVIPAEGLASAQGFDLELFVRVRHRSGGTLRSQGSVDRPIVVAVSPGQVQRPAPLYTRWWFWAGSAAAVVGAVLLVDQARDVGPQPIVLER